MPTKTAGKSAPYPPALRRLTRNFSTPETAATFGRFVGDVFEAVAKMQSGGPQAPHWAAALVKNHPKILSVAAKRRLDPLPYQRLCEWIAGGPVDPTMAVDLRRFLERLRWSGSATTGEKPADKPAVGGTDSDAATETLDRESRALAVLVKHPDWSNTAIAKKAKVHRGSLYRMQRFMDAKAAMAGQGKANRRQRQDAQQGITDDDSE